MEIQNEKKSADFEQEIAALKEIVDKLEPDVSLDDGMKLFGEGLRLTEECIDYLNKTKATLAELNGKLDIILGEDTNVR